MAAGTEKLDSAHEVKYSPSIDAIGFVHDVFGEVSGHSFAEKNALPKITWLFDF